MSPPRNPGAANFNQFARNIARLPYLIEEYEHLRKEAEKNFGKASVLFQRAQPGTFNQAYQQRILNQRYAKINRNYARIAQLNTEIANAKRRLLGMVSPRYRQNMGPLGIDPLSLRTWNPTKLISAIRTLRPFENRIYKAALSHANKPKTQRPKLLRNMASMGHPQLVPANYKSASPKKTHRRTRSI